MIWHGKIEWCCNCVGSGKVYGKPVDVVEFREERILIVFINLC